jgi:hypothetical protein
MADPQVQIGSVSNIYSRQTLFVNAGDSETQTYTFDNLTLLATGQVSVTVNGTTTNFTAPHMIYIQANKTHQITALVDNTLAFSVHVLRDYTDAVLDPSMIPQGISPLVLSQPILSQLPNISWFVNPPPSV